MKKVDAKMKGGFLRIKIGIAISLLMTFIISSESLGATPSDPTKKCCCSTIEVMECLEKMTKEAEARLDRIYRKLHSQRETEDQQLNKSGSPSGASAYSAQALQSAQKAWITYRDLNCQFQHSLSYPGTGAPLEYGSCIIRMNEERASELERDIHKTP